MKDAIDVMGHISKQRRVITEDRAGIFPTTSTASVETCNTSTIPMLVVELVSEHVYSERVPFHRTLSWGLSEERLD